jgi:Tol biopolymer transport system component
VILCNAEDPYGTPHWMSDNTIVWSQAAGIMRVSGNGGTPELLVADSENEGFLQPQILPDGKSVLFGSGDPFEPKVIVHSIDSGDRKVLFSGVWPKYVSTGHIIYSLGTVLFAVPFDLDSLETVGGAVSMVQGVRGTPRSHYAVSEAGTLAFLPGNVGAATDRNLALVDRAGVVKRLNVPPKEYISPRLSPDGQKLAVESIQSADSVIWVYDLSGKTAIQQLTFEGNNQWPIWTPDGKWITFSSDRGGTRSLYMMPADGSGVAERLTTAPDGTMHWPGSWSPDGKTLVFHVVKGALGSQTPWHIWKLSRDRGETQRLYDAPDTSYNGAELSRDGKWLAYGARPNPGTVDIYVEPFPPTGSRRRISQNGGYWPMWSANGRELFYRPLASTGANTLKAVNVATEPEFGFSNEQTLPIQGFITVTYHRDYDITADGQNFVMMFPADQADFGGPTRDQINIVLNWTEELKQRVPVK